MPYTAMTSGSTKPHAPTRSQKASASGPSVKSLADAAAVAPTAEPASLPCMASTNAANTATSSTTSTTTDVSRSRWVLADSAARLGDAATISTKATPVSKAETVNRHGSSTVFHSGTPGTDISRTPVYTATHRPSAMPTTASTGRRRLRTVA